MKYLSYLFIFTSFYAYTQEKHECHLAASIECEDFIMGKLRRSDYDDASEYQEIRNACTGNAGSKCLENIIPYLSTFDTDSRFELTSLAKGCQQTNSSCVEFIRTKILSFEFDDIREINEVTFACTRSNVSCMQRFCNTRQYSCIRKYELVQVAKLCQDPCSN